MNQSTTVTLGTLSLLISQLTLGQLKKVRAEIQTLLAMRASGESMPTVEQLDAMVAVLHVSTSVQNTALTREAITAAVDALPYDVAMQQLGEAIAIVMRTSGLNEKPGGTGAGEAPSPAS